MISSKKLIKLARKWHKLAALNRKRIGFPNYTVNSSDANICSTSDKAEKGHFVVYSSDLKRFMLPLVYLNNEVIRELFSMAEEEFGLPGSGPLMLPCEAEIIEYAVDLIKRKANRDVERAFLSSIATSCCSLPSHHLHHVTTHQLPICTF